MDLKNGVFHGRPAYWLAILVLLAGLLLSLLWAVTFGSVDLKMGDVYRVILYKVTEALHFPVGDSEVYGSGSMSDIVWFVRLPRLVLAIGVGMALALAGVVMQAIVKNPLADPYVLGVSSGASLGATLAILVGVGSFLGSGYVGLVAFAGAFLVSMGVIALANIGGRATSPAAARWRRWSAGPWAAWPPQAGTPISGCWRCRYSGRSFSGPSTAP